MAESSKLVVRELAPDEDDLWREFVSAAPSGSAYSQRAYVEALCDATGGGTIVLGAFRGDAIAGGIAVYEHASPVGPFVAPRLLLYYNGLVLREYETRYPSERSAREVEVIAALASAMTGRGYGRLELRSRSPVVDARPFLVQGWRVEPSYSYVVPLTDLETQWDRMERNLRRLVERGNEHGLTLSVDEDFDAFYELHELTHTRKGAPLYLEREAFRRYYTRLRRRACATSSMPGYPRARLPRPSSFSSAIRRRTPRARGQRRSFSSWGRARFCAGMPSSGSQRTATRPTT